MPGLSASLVRIESTTMTCARCRAVAIITCSVRMGLGQIREERITWLLISVISSPPDIRSGLARQRGRDSQTSGMVGFQSHNGADEPAEHRLRREALGPEPRSLPGHRRSSPLSHRRQSPTLAQSASVSTPSLRINGL
jgi:hypothetical protein